MRELDRNIVYLDALNNPLVGRVTFYAKGTTDKLNIYADDGETTIENPMYTSNGRLDPQVFLQDKDYTIEWQKYIGEGPMVDDDDPDDWVFSGSCVSLTPQMHIEIENAGLVCVNTVADLRNLDPINLGDKTMVTLLGYYAVGDKPSVNYVWNPLSLDDDDGGAVIKCSAKKDGRYILVNDGEKIDARDFGAFPQPTPEYTSNAQALRLLDCHSYAMRHHLYVSLPDLDGGVGFYRLLSSVYTRLVCENSNARLLGLDSATVRIAQFKDKSFFIYHKNAYNAEWTIIGTALKGSFNTSNSTNVVWNVSGEYVVDNVNQTGCPHEFTNCKVVFDVLASMGYSFDSCEIVARGKLNADYANSFTNCKYTDRYFADPSKTIDPGLDGCYFRIEDFGFIKNWVEAKIAQGDYVFDFEGAGFDFVLNFQHDVIIRNLIGTITVKSLFRNKNASFFKCNVTIADGGIMAGAFDFDDCQVACNDGVFCATLSAKHTVFNGGISYGAGIALTSVSLESCTVNGYTMGNIVIAKNCQFESFVRTYCNSDNDNIFRFENCTFNGTGAGHILNLGGSMPGAGGNVKGVWRNNLFNATTAIQVEGFASDLPNAHSYIYEGNTGTAIKNKVIVDVHEYVKGELTLYLNDPNARCDVFGFGEKLFKLRLWARVKYGVKRFDYAQIYINAYQNLNGAKSVRLDGAATDEILNTTKYLYGTNAEGQKGYGDYNLEFAYAELEEI